MLDFYESLNDYRFISAINNFTEEIGLVMEGNSCIFSRDFDPVDAERYDDNFI
jgi:hypothetical protein